MLYAEAKRHGPHQDIFLDTVRDVLDSVAPVIDRWPQYAWVAKQLLEAERVRVGCYSGLFLFCSSHEDVMSVLDRLGGMYVCFGNIVRLPRTIWLLLEAVHGWVEGLYWDYLW